MKDAVLSTASKRMKDAVLSTASFS